jgi:trimeric autotransporter adhesin
VVRKSLVVAMLSVVSLFAGVAMAVPPANAPASNTFMLDGQVRSVGIVGGNAWMGGRFATVLDGDGQPAYAADNLAVMTQDGTGIDIAPDVDGMIWDLWVNGTTVYVAGAFTTVGGQSRSNLAAIDGLTGAVLPFSVSSPKLKSVAVVASVVYGGGKDLRAYTLAGSKLTGWVAPRAAIDSAIRGGRSNKGAFRDLTPGGGSIVAACQCDSVTRGGVTQATKAVIKVDPSTGALSPWTPTELQPSSAAMGRDVLVANDSVYAAIGGSDFIARYDLATGNPIWKLDTNGSAQALAMTGSDLVVGGHFRWVAGGGATACSNNTVCIYQPKLVAADAITGAIAHHAEQTSVGSRKLADWDPAFCCEYNGVWTLAVDGQGDLWVGGQYTKVGTAWDPARMIVDVTPKALSITTQRYIAELS